MRVKAVDQNARGEMTLGRSEIEDIRTEVEAANQDETKTCHRRETGEGIGTEIPKMQII